MSPVRTTFCAVLAIAAFLVAPGTAGAQTLTKQTPAACDQDGGLTNFVTQPKVLTLPRFNVAGGTLTNVTIIENLSMRSDFGVESFDEEPQTVEFSFDGSVTLAVPTLPSRTVALSATRSVSLARADGNNGSANPDFDGPSGETGVVGPDQDGAVRSSPDLAAWSGTGVVEVTAQASAVSSQTDSGNYDHYRRTRADASVCVVYTYTEEVLVCIGDYVWYDADRDGVQDPTEQPVPGRLVTVVDTNGSTLGSATTDGNGRWTVCQLEPSTPCIINVDLPEGWSLSPAGQGGNAGTDSDGLPAGADATVPCATPARGSDLTFDVGINQVVVEEAPAPAPARLRATKVANRTSMASRAVVTFTVRVSNLGGSSAERLTVCDSPPAQLAFTSRPRGSFVRNGQLCWRTGTIAAGRAATYRYTMRAANVARRACAVNRVTVVAGTGGSTAARDSVCIRPTRLGLLQLAG